jgi:outer membrane protein assembly factor BamB
MAGTTRATFAQEFRMSDAFSKGPSAHYPDEDAPPLPKPPINPRLRLWPGVVVVALLWLVLWPVLVRAEWLESVGLDQQRQFSVWMFAPMVATAALALWWLLASGLPWLDRVLGLVAFALAGAGMVLASHPTVGVYGLILYGLQTAATAWVVWLLLTPFVPWPARRVGLFVVFVLAFGYYTLLRVDGAYSNLVIEKEWRWSQTAEDKFKAERASKPKAAPAPAPDAKKLAVQTSDWPGFRGAQRNGQRPGVRIRTDWKDHPPALVWKQRVCPGWGSFAVVGDRLYTQEQRGQEEVVVCYDARTGDELWVHNDPARFEEMVSGPGPRATPTFHKGKLFTLGASGVLNCLDAADGKVVWSHDIIPDIGLDANADPKVKKVPQWGFAASPLVVHDLVLVYTGTSQGKGMLAYKADKGELAWAKGDAAHSYCSPHLAKLGDVEQVLIADEAGLTAFEPVKGAILWSHSWPAQQAARIVQPAVLGESDVLVGTGSSYGTRRLHLSSKKGSGWEDREEWTTKAIKPYFNDFVVHKGHIYGFDNGLLTCVALEDGKSCWRQRGYDNGQVLLLPDQDLLLVLTERGVAALVEAKPDKHTQLGRFQALEGKTWNHPVVAHGKLFVRNGEFAACYDLGEAK